MRNYRFSYKFEDYIIYSSWITGLNDLEAMQLAHTLSSLYQTKVSIEFKLIDERNNRIRRTY